MHKYFLLTLFISFSILADDEPSFPGLVSSEVFNLGNGMVMHVERRNSCNQDGTPKHFHPAAGTLVYVLDGTSQSKSSGCLLYTSPSPRDRTRSRMPSSA